MNEPDIIDAAQYAGGLNDWELLAKLQRSLEARIVPRSPDDFRFNLSPAEIAVQEEVRKRFPEAPEQIELTWLEQQIRRTQLRGAVRTPD